MKKNLVIAQLIALLFLFKVELFSQYVVIYEQNFDGNNGTFPTGIVSSSAPVNGWIASSTSIQSGNYRHVWNISSTGTGIFAPISGNSLGMGFYDGNIPFSTNPFQTYNGASCGVLTVANRWASVGVSTVGYTNIQVEFKWRCAGEIDGGIVYDYGTVNTSINGGATWSMDTTGGQSGTTALDGTFSGGLYYNNSGVQTQIINLPATRDNQADFRLAFRMVVDECYGTGGGFIVDDIVIRGIPMAACLAGTATGSGTVITGNSASLSVTGNLGTTMQWQVSSDSINWVNVSGGTGANSASYNTGALSTGVYYYRFMASDVACVAYSNVIKVVVAPSFPPCSGAGSGNAPSTNYISNILFHEWNDPNPNYSTSNYLDYSDTSIYNYATVVAGQYHHLSIGVRAGGTGTNSSTLVYWIDWNNDGVFNNTPFSSGGERIDLRNFTYNGLDSYAGYFTVPSGVSGAVRVRVRVLRGSFTSVDPCGVYTNSQTKDFTLKILPSIGPQVCLGANGNANAVQANTTSDKVYISEVRVDGPGGTIMSNPSTYFGVVNASLNAMYNYSNFMGAASQGLELMEGEMYTVRVYHSEYTSVCGVFIDFNGDGDFNDANELIGRISSGTLWPYVFTFTVPPGVVDGKQVVMRIRNYYDDYLNLDNTLHGCNNISDGFGIYSEVEDYRITLRSIPEPLPVSLLNFNVTCVKEGVQVKWETNSEVNNEKFIVQYSPNMSDWHSVGEVLGAGNSNQILEYSWFDTRAKSEIAYYRLVQVDYNGDTEVFTAKSVSCEDVENNYLIIFPNPVTDLINIQTHSSLNADNAVFELFDMQGKLCVKTNQSVKEGSSNFTMDIKGLSSGVYVLNAKWGAVNINPVKVVIKGS